MKFNFSPFPELLTERLILRQITSCDCPQILFLRSDEEVNAFIKRPAPNDLKDAELFLEKISKGVKNKALIYWGIALKETPEMIGSICLWNFSTAAKKVEIGYDLNPKFQNLGIMTEAMKAVLEYGFQDLQANTIEAFTHYQNENSIKLLQKNGFSIVPNKKDPDNVDNIVFSLKSTNKD
jgi:ribosomal-protein-alanine N-acetyltransferase